MDFKFTKKEVELLLEHLYRSWDMLREDLNDKEADRVSKLHDKIIDQYKAQKENK